MWEKLIERDGLEAARGIMEQDDDFAFGRNHLTRELAEELGRSTVRAATGRLPCSSLT